MSVEEPNEQHAPMHEQLGRYRALVRDNVEGWRDEYGREVRVRFGNGIRGSKRDAAVAVHYEYLLGEAIRQLGEWEGRG